MSDYGIKISLPGYDVKTATPEQCVIHSGYACPKMKLGQTPAHFGTYTKVWASDPGDGVTVLKTINHALGYKPMIAVMINFDRTGDGDIVMMPLPAQGGLSLQIYAYATTADLKIAINRAAAGTNPTGETWIFKYYIFVENGA